MDSLEERLLRLESRLEEVLVKAGRARSSLMVLAVSKKQPLEKIRQLITAGQRHFGENYVAEAVEKIEQLQGSAVDWHMIGHLQRNKAKVAAQNFDWVHTIDAINLATRLNQYRLPSHPKLNVCIQVNIDQSPSKHGVDPSQLVALAEQVLELPHLKLRGLMAMPDPASPQQTQNQFAKVRQLKQNLNDRGFDLDTLSMGMSQDFEWAILEGATIIRIGTLLMGPRI